VSDARGKYRIQTVAEMTGIPAATLRAWERRYGVPVPARSDSSYRLYSDADLAMIQRLRALCDGGMAPSDAARMVLDQDAAVAPLPAGDDVFAPMRAGILHAVEMFDPYKLERELDRATALGTATAIVDRILRPVMTEIGDAWHDGRLSVAQEHLATDAIVGVTRRLLALVQPESDARLVVLACFADEQHSFPLQALAVHVASWGFRVVMLGASTPPAAIKHAVKELRPKLVGLSCTVAPAGHRARELVEAYADAVGDTPWLVGGSAARELSRFVVARGGHVTDELDPRALRTIVERLASTSTQPRR
jgi:DNA-binding transcriptional MerR regulator/methylmalonyl-CoA mutase cobalamin-binding subunit